MTDGEGDALSATVHASHVLVRPEETDSAVIASVALHALEIKRA